MNNRINIYIMQTPDDIALAYKKGGSSVKDPVDLAVFVQGSQQELSFKTWYYLSSGKKGQLETWSFDSPHSARYFEWGIQRLLQMISPVCGSVWLTVENVERENWNGILHGLSDKIAEYYRQFPPAMDPDKI
jgi:hypothetical protein